MRNEFEKNLNNNLIDIGIKSETKQSMSKLLRRRYKNPLKHLHTRHSDWIQVGSLILNVAAIVIVATMATMADISSLLITLVVQILAIGFIGSRMRALGNIMHECAHGTFLKRRIWNHRLGCVLSVMDFSSFSQYRQDHMTHHIYLGDKKLDRDFAARETFGFEAELTPQTAFMHLKNIVSIKFYRVYLKPIFLSKYDSRSVVALRVIWVALLIALFLFFGVYGFTMFFIVPYITTYQWLRYFSDVVDHAGLIGIDPSIKGQELARTRNHLFSNQIFNWLFFPSNDMFHAVHHLFPEIPNYRLAEAHQVLLNDPNYASKGHSFKSIIVTNKTKKEHKNVFGNTF